MIFFSGGDVDGRNYSVSARMGRTQIMVKLWWQVCSWKGPPGLEQFWVVVNLNKAKKGFGKWIWNLESEIKAAALQTALPVCIDRLILSLELNVYNIFSLGVAWQNCNFYTNTNNTKQHFHVAVPFEHDMWYCTFGRWGVIIWWWRFCNIFEYC